MFIAMSFQFEKEAPEAIVWRAEKPGKQGFFFHSFFLFFFIIILIKHIPTSMIVALVRVEIDILGPKVTTSVHGARDDGSF